MERSRENEEKRGGEEKEKWKRVLKLGGQNELQLKGGNEGKVVEWKVQQRKRAKVGWRRK